MNKLFDSMSTGSQIELFNVVENTLKVALSGKSDQFFFNIDAYLNAAPSAKKDMATKGIARLEQYIEENGWKIAPKFLERLSGDYLAIFYALEQYVHVGIDMEKEGYPSALYTRATNILRYLSQNGQLEGDLDKILSALHGSKTEKSIKEGNFVVVRLDVEGVKEGNPIFKGVIPRSNLEIGLGKQFVFIPVPFFYMFENMVFSHFLDKPFNFVKSTVIGPVSHNVAISPNVVREVYAGNDGDLVESKIRKIKVGYDVIKQRFFAYDLEASLHSLGIASFRPEMLDSIKEISYDEIDKSKHNVNFNYLRGIFKTKIKSLTREQLEKLNFIDISGFANMKDQVEAILTAADNKTDAEVYAFMKNNPHIFGDIEEALAKRERVAPKFLKGLEAVALPTSEEKRIKLLSDMLERGVVKFTAISKSGTLLERTASNNKKVLERMLGKDYVKQFESIRNKLYHVRDMITNGEIKSKLDLEKVGVEYNILDYVDPKDYFSGNMNDAIEAIDKAIEELKQKAASRKTSESMLLYRNIYATDPKDFFGTVNVNNIVAVEFAEA